MAVHFRESPPGLEYRTMELKGGNDYQEFVEVYHVVPGTRKVVPSGQMCRIRRDQEVPSMRRLGRMCYLALLPPRPAYPCTALDCATKALLFLVQTLFYVYVVSFSWVMLRRLLEWGV